MPHLVAIHSEPETAEVRGTEAKVLLVEKTDREIIEAMCSDSVDHAEGALAEMVRRKTQPLLRTVERILHNTEDARDVVQMTFLRVWDRREQYDPRWSPNTWIYRIATNLAIDHLRSRQSKERQSEPVRQHMLHLADGGARRPLFELRHKEVDTIFEQLAVHLSEKQRLAFLLREIEGFSSAEAAEVMECRESTVRNHLFVARKVLRRELKKRYPEYSPSGSGDNGGEGRSS